MKHLIFAITVLTLSTPALAADLAPQAADPIAPVALYDWTGFYVGVNAGYGFSSGHTVHTRETNFSTENQLMVGGHLTQSGVVGGIQGGYNWQTGHVILGVEADIQATGISDSSSYLAKTNYWYGTKNAVPWFGSVRPRVGLQFDNVLIYGTGGLAFGQVNTKQKYNDVLANSPALYDIYNYNKSRIKAGYTLGAGVEYAVTQHWTVKLEYDYVDLGKSDFSAREILDTGVPNPRGYVIHTTGIKSDFSTVKLGLNYKF